MIHARLVIILGILSFPFTIFGQNNSFDSFISRLSDQYEVDVAVAPELIPVLDSLKNYNAAPATLEQFLRQVFRHTFITYEILDGNKVLLRRELNTNSNEQQRIVQGYVKDKFQKPLSFAGVSIPNSARGTYTDEEGFFQFAVDQSSEYLQIHYLGYKTQVVPVEKFIGSHYEVEMESDNIPLDLVTIIVPYYHLSAYQFYTTPDHHTMHCKLFQKPLLQD